MKKGISCENCGQENVPGLWDPVFVSLSRGSQRRRRCLYVAVPLENLCDNLERAAFNFQFLPSSLFGLKHHQWSWCRKTSTIIFCWWHLEIFEWQIESFSPAPIYPFFKKKFRTILANSILTRMALRQEGENVRCHVRVAYFLQFTRFFRNNFSILWWKFYFWRFFFFFYFWQTFYWSMSSWEAGFEGRIQKRRCQ